jgi:hypothetical protein
MRNRKRYQWRSQATPKKAAIRQRKRRLGGKNSADAPAIERSQEIAQASPLALFEQNAGDKKPGQEKE